MSVRSASGLRRAEEAEERYLQLFRDMPVGMFAYSRDDRRFEPNPALARMFGYQGPEHMSTDRPAREFLIDEGERRRLLKDLIRDGAVANFVTATERLDGSTIWVSIDARAVVSGNNVERIEGIARDITDQVNVDAELHKTQERFASLVHDAPILFASVDSEARLTHVAGDVLKEIGMEPSAMVGQPLSTFFGAREEVMAHFARALAGETFNCPGILGGRQFHVHYRPLTHDSGAVTGAMMVAVDVTERAEAEAVAELSRERLEWVLGSTPIMLVSVDTHGVFNFAGGQVAERVGIDLATVLGQTYQELFKGTPQIVEWWRRTIAGEAHLEEIQHLEHMYLTYFFPLHREGEPIGAAMVGMDITDRADAQRQAAARARYQAVVIRVGAAALASSDHGQLLQEAISSMAQVLEVPLAAAFEIQHEQETATVMAMAVDTDIDAMVGTRVPLSDLSSYRNVVASGHAVAVDDYDRQTEFSRNQFMTTLGARASMAALIPGAERALGTIILISRSPRAWTSYELEFVQIMANMMSVALQRTRAEEQRRYFWPDWLARRRRSVARSPATSTMTPCRS